MLFVFFLSFLLLLVDNILIFYFIYEILLILIFRIIYLSSNARGGIEGSLFYAAWALVGSILVGLGFMGVIILSNSISFLELRGCNKLTANEIYYLYLLFFFGFGTKLSI
jgi:formate hydrogenlyase subunit 3/multisubunit Na+/H+ antiporter MnhD subunit